MALDSTIPIDGDGLTYGVKVSELAGYIRQLKSDLNNGKLQIIGDGDNYDSYVKVNDDDTIDIYTNGTQIAHIYDSGIIDWYKQSGCEAKLTSDQTIPSGSWTKLNLVAQWDLQGEWDDTNHRWTCTKAGKYLIAIGQLIYSIADTKGMAVEIQKNGAVYRPRESARYGAAETYATLSASAIINLAVGDYIEMIVYQDTGLDQTAKSGDTASWLSIFKLS